MNHAKANSRHVLLWEDFSAEDLHWLCAAGWRVVGREMKPPHYFYASAPHELTSDEFISIVPTRRFLSLRLVSTGQVPIGVERHFERANPTHKLGLQWDCCISAGAILKISLHTQTGEEVICWTIEHDAVLAPDGSTIPLSKPLGEWARITALVDMHRGDHQIGIGKRPPIAGQIERRLAASENPAVLRIESSGTAGAESLIDNVYLFESDSIVLEPSASEESPATHQDQNGIVHAAFATSEGVVYTGPLAERTLILPGVCDPAMIGDKEQIVVAGLKLTSLDCPDGVVQARRIKEGRWMEIETLTPEGFTSPSLSIDPHGVITLFTTSPDRHWIYRRRLLGDQWGALQECRGAFASQSTRMDPGKSGPLHWLGLPQRVVAERYCEPDQPTCAITVSERPWSDHVQVHRLPTCRIPAKPGGRVLFLDNEELVRTHNIRHRLGETKRFGRPVLTHGDEGAWDSNAASIYGTVLNDNSMLRMWYTGYPRRAETRTAGSSTLHEHVGLGIGYAESADGIAWNKPNLGQWGNSNRIRIEQTVEGDTKWINPNIFINPDAKSAAEKYVMLAEGKSPPCRGKMAFSPDGVQWTVARPDAQHATAGGNGCFVTPEMEIQSFVIADDGDPSRELKTYGQPRPRGNIRAQSIGWSSAADAADLKKWHGSSAHVVLDPHSSLDPGELQDHRMLVWKQYGYYLGLYEVYNHLEYFVDIRLAVSRDGFNWVRIDPGRAFIPIGRRGWWDGGMLVVSTRPVEFKGKHRLYYAGGSLCQMSPGYKLSNARNIGFVEFPLDGFASLSCADPSAEAVAVTLPFDTGGQPPLSLTVNAIGLESETNLLRVEVLDGSTGRAIPGFTRPECAPIRASGRDIPIRWNNAVHLPARGLIQLRFVLKGPSTRLFGFGFASDSR